MPDASTLYVQPRQRRAVYEFLATLPAGLPVKDLLHEIEIPEADLREALRKLDASGLAHRMKGSWSAIPLDTADDATSDAGAETYGAAT